MDGEAVADRLTNTCEAEQREQREAMERSLTRDEERIEVLDKMVMRLYEDASASGLIIGDTSIDISNAMSIPANPDAWGTDRNCYLAVNSHPGLVDLFLSQTRKAYAQEQQKTSVRDKLKKPPETTSPKISAKSKAPER